VGGWPDAYAQSCTVSFDQAGSFYGRYAEACTRSECILFEFDVVSLSSEGYVYYRVTDELCSSVNEDCWLNHAPYSEQSGALEIDENHIRLSNLISDNNEYYYIIHDNKEYLLNPDQYERYWNRSGNLPRYALRKTP